MKILILNALDSGCGSTYRARQFRRVLTERGHRVTYVEPNLGAVALGESTFRQSGSARGFLWSSMRLSWLAARGDHDVLIVEKLNPLTAGALFAGKR